MEADKVLRTPDRYFTNLPGFSFEPHYFVLNDSALGALRMHYIDEGRVDRGTVLMLHGEPSWSFLYRKMIAPVAAAGWRCVVPDHIGFGRSDKPTDRSAFTADRFVSWMRALVQGLDLHHIVLVCQDWGGPIGLRLLGEMPERFAAVFATNTVLPNGEPPPRGIADWPGPTIAAWIEHCRTSDDLAVSEIVAATCVERPDPGVLAAYDAPFPDARYKAAALAITTQIPTDPAGAAMAANRVAWDVLDRWEKPFATAFSDGDPSTAAWEGVFRNRVPGAASSPHWRIAGAGHFVQEERGDALARALVAFLETVEGAGR